MKRFSIVLVVLGLSITSFAFQSQTYLDYIAQWRDVAIRHQQMYGIPASITMAQGLLESGAGTSELAKNANNHFGIKCTSEWMGDVYRYDDDRKDECFRVYLNAEESYKDHALFLQRSRYARLFTIPVADYGAWARGLKECGYATDPAYAQKLIRVIEDYNLASLTSDTSRVVGGAAPQYGGQGGANTPVNTQVAANGVVMVTEGATIASFAKEQTEEYIVPRTDKEEKALFYSKHAVLRNNGVKYVKANEGDTYATIAYSLNVKERSLREQNDAVGRTLKPGERVYLGKKKSQAPKEKAYVWVRPGETVWSICQREGITEKSFRDMNGLRDDVRVFETRQQVLLRKEKKQ